MIETILLIGGTVSCIATCLYAIGSFYYQLGEILFPNRKLTKEEEEYEEIALERMIKSAIAFIAFMVAIVIWGICNNQFY